ncbi:MAG TPA: aldehyde dehydrogenase family protein, partial [Proteobacteria bacterium]|nr:aldehyde dehydrogenase family protein [Pseudomonadota bacterium]
MVMREEFKNEPLADFSDPEVRRKMEDALAEVKGWFGREYPLVIGGDEVWTDQRFESLNPSRPSEVVGVFCKASEKDAEAALDAAWKAFEKWRFETPQKRADLLFRAAELLRERRFILDAAMVLE